MDYVLQGFGVFLGVVAGTAVTLLLQWANRKRYETQTVSNFKFELQLNVRKIEGWLDELVKYRNAVNGDAPGMYFGWFDLSRSIFVTTNSMFYSGLLYRYLDHDAIGRIQVILSDLSQNGENYLMNQIMQHKTNFNKTQAVSDINFWEEKFKGHKKTLETIQKKLG